MRTRPGKPLFTPAKSAWLAVLSVLTLIVALLIADNATAAGTPVSLWKTTDKPATNANSGPAAPDSVANELGVKFKADSNGQITGVKFYKGTGNTGTHVGHLWAASGGAALATVTFTGESATGWQTATFATPVNVAAGTTYVASYYAPKGHYAYTYGGLTSAKDTPPLHTIASDPTGPAGGNGVYKTGSTGFPASSYRDTNYWVDVVFVPTAAPPSSSTTAPPSSSSTTTSSPTSSSSAPPTTTTPPPVVTIENIWPTTAVPANLTAADVPVNLGVKFTTSTAGYIAGVRFYKGDATNGGTHVGQLWDAAGNLLAQATFTGETTSGWQDVRFSDMVPVSANTTYVASYHAPQANYSYDTDGLINPVNNAPSPLTALGSAASGGNGVYVAAGGPAFPTQSYRNTNYWVDVDFTTTYVAALQPTPRAGVRGSGPVLVLTDPTVPFTDTICGSILQTEGLAPVCAATDTGNLNGSFPLSNYRAVIRADGAALTDNQVAQITAWVQAGGSYTSLRPAPNENTLLGIGAKTGTLSDAYLKVDTTQAPGAGIETATMQYHSAADQHPLAGARAVATLYSNATTATTFPAVTENVVGAGKASAFLYDLARSTVYLREGNPALAGQATTSPDGKPRLADRFGNGWLDLSKAGIPQADMQQRLLANMLQSATPLPRLWYFPTYKGAPAKATIVLTGDDHQGASQTLSRFAAEQAATPGGCSVADWTCRTSTSYAYPGSFSDAAAKPYTDAGFEVAPHIADNGGSTCAENWTTQAQLDAIATAAIQAWQNSFPTIAAAHAAVTQRFHCYGVWKDYATVAKVEATHGMVADTNSSCWPQAAWNVGQCLFTGTGMPQQFVDSDGTPTGAYQWTTQITDENLATVDKTAMDTLIKNGTGANAYYGYFTALCHLDNQVAGNQCATDLLDIAGTNDVPMVSTAQAQKFVSDRAATSVSSLAYTASTMSFSLTAPAANLPIMIPVTNGAKTLSGVTIGGNPAAYTTQVVNGISYAFVNAAAGAYVATYN